MKITFFLIIAFLVLGCKQNREYQIVGTFKENTTDEWIFLSKYMDGFSKVDSARIVNNQFSLNGPVGFPEFYVLTNGEQMSSKNLGFFLEPGKINIAINSNDWSDGVVISGGEVNEEYQRLEKEIFDKEQDKMQAFSGKMLNDQMRIYKELKKLKPDSRMEYVNTHPDSPISIFYYSLLFSKFPADSIEITLAKFSPEVKQTLAYKFINTHYKPLN